MNTNFDRSDRHTAGRKTQRRYMNTHDTDAQTDNKCSMRMMHMADGFSDVCFNGFLMMTFLTDLHVNRVEKNIFYNVQLHYKKLKTTLRVMLL